ncbi:hypothetical protein DKM44_12935 [Deinococcus irradiatisoli]|uniref:Uncharacterized protein n=1 Tax=Deinococcus irradiatisoli TaxID=2202254 RepID=A0A2Z3JJ65_9DEIO|nr:hypothetical protein [Deinococcus irradiatisoli]AWN24026.1 hypothetical protein DKM44_12935 [Deinococcus irradiatisoli]
MTITPTKSRPKQAPPVQPNYREVDERRRVWIAQLPPEIDTDAVGTLSSNEALSFTWNVAGHARNFMEWTHFQPREWTPWGNYDQRLARVCRWLAQQPEDQLPYRRDDALQILRACWPKYLEKVRDPELLFDTIPSLWIPDDEFGPLDAPLPYLPIWEVIPRDPDITPEQLERRWEAARIGEEFALYAGLTTYLNVTIGLKLLDLGDSPF